MDQDHLGYITKLGISITTISTISLIALNRSYYFGYFIGFEINPTVIHVEMRDLLTPNLLMLVRVFNFVLGYLLVLELYRWGILKHTNKSISSQPQAKLSTLENLASIGALFYFILALTITIASQNWAPFLVGTILVFLGMMFYVALDFVSLHLKLFSIIIIACLLLTIESIDGYIAAGKSQTRATINTQRGDVIKDSQYIYSNSQTYFVIKKGAEKTLTCIPRSQVLEASIFEHE